MQRRRSIRELCGRYRNEDVHTEHVTRLALLLFDRTRRRLRTPAGDRRLLEAACRLHDVGWSVDPANHAEAGAEIVTREGVADLPAQQRAHVAAVILLHRRKYRELLEHPIVRAARNPGRVMRIAAILRIADGLDHGHIQNAWIKSVRWRGDAFAVSVCCEGYAGAVTWADAKADLWRDAFPHGISFEMEEPPADGPVFAGVVCQGASVRETARRILYSQYRTMMDNHGGALEGDSPEHLHDIRVANRRFRAALRLFQSHLDETSGRRIRRALSQLVKKTGSARDLDVWLRFLQGVALPQDQAGGTAWSDYLGRQRGHKEALSGKLTEVLRSEEYKAIMSDAAAFLRIELPDFIRRTRPQPARPYVARRLRRVFRRITEHAHLQRKLSPAEMHEIRRLCRRERYWAEFAEPLLGPIAADLVRRLKAVADTLGDVHDMDVAVERLDAEPDWPPHGLRELLLALRKTYLADFKKTWKHLTNKKFQKRLMRELNSARKGEWSAPRHPTPDT